MTTEEISNLYIRIAFQYESALEQLVDKGLVDKDFADKSRQTFYSALDEEKLRTAQKIRSHMEIIRRYTRGMICEDMVSLTELARQHSKDSPGYIIQSWMRSRNTLEFLRQWENDMNGEFVSAYPEIAADFHLWLDPAERLALVRLICRMNVNQKTM